MLGTARVFMNEPLAWEHFLLGRSGMPGYLATTFCVYT